MSKSNIHFTGIFKDEFENYIDYKQSQGYYKSLYKKNIYELLNYNRLSIPLIEDHSLR